MSDIETVRQVLEDSLASELRQHRTELGFIRSKLTTKIEAAESRLDSKINMLEAKMNAVDSKIGSGFSALHK